MTIAHRVHLGNPACRDEPNGAGMRFTKADEVGSVLDAFGGPPGIIRLCPELSKSSKQATGTATPKMVAGTARAGKVPYRELKVI